jgi:hypothetical protein
MQSRCLTTTTYLRILLVGQFQLERHLSACNGPKTVQNPGTQKSSTTNRKKLSTTQ